MRLTRAQAEQRASMLVTLLLLFPPRVANELFDLMYPDQAESGERRDRSIAR